MYLVIFSATINKIDDEYTQTANKMRKLAIEKYGCLEFNSVTEGKQEIAISYWPTLKCIKEWKNDPEHLKAQRHGQARWYREYKVQIAKIESEYEKHL